MTSPNEFSEWILCFNQQFIRKVFTENCSLSSAFPEGSSSLADPLTFSFSDPKYDHVDGSGQTIVIIDSGIDLDHPAFGPDSNGDGISDRIIYSQSFVPGQDVDYIAPKDHGSHVAGIAASSNETYTGVAPGADIIALKALSYAGSGATTWIENALKWTVQNAEEYSIDVVNMSLGGSLYTQYEINEQCLW